MTKRPLSPIKWTFECIQKQIQQVEWKMALKVGVAGGAGLLASLAYSQLLAYPQTFISGIWCVLSAVVVLQAHLGGTYQAAWRRFLGVFIGSLMGGFFTFLIGSNPLSLAMSLAFTAILCQLLLLKDSVRIACMSVAIVMILWGLRPEESPWTFAWYRFLDSVLGIVIAVIVAHTLWPAEATQKIRFHIARTLDAISRLYLLILSTKPVHQSRTKVINQLAKEIENLLNEDREFLEASRLEIRSHSRSVDEWRQLVDHTETLFQAIMNLRDFHDDLKKIFDEPLTDALSELIMTTEASFGMIAQMLEMGTQGGKWTPLAHGMEKLNEELIRFRTTRTTRQFDFRDVEHYFVFFYHIRLVAEELIKMEKKIGKLG